MEADSLAGVMCTERSSGRLSSSTWILACLLLLVVILSSHPKQIMNANTTKHYNTQTYGSLFMCACSKCPSHPIRGRQQKNGKDELNPNVDHAFLSYSRIQVLPRVAHSFDVGVYNKVGDTYRCTRFERFPIAAATDAAKFWVVNSP